MAKPFNVKCVKKSYQQKGKVINRHIVMSNMTNLHDIYLVISLYVCKCSITHLTFCLH